MRWSKNVAESLVKNSPGKVALKCVDCGKIFIIDENVSLNKQVAGHTWKGDYTLRELTYEDWLNSEAEKELCPVCGVPHGPNPYTGCELE